MEIKRTFLYVDKLFFNITSANESYIYSEVIDHNDVIIMISYSGENASMLEFAKKLKTKSVPIILSQLTKIIVLHIWLVNRYMWRYQI